MKFNTTILTLLTLFNLTIATAQDGGGKSSFKQRFEAGNLLMEDKHFEIAIPLWKELLKEQPDNANLNYKIGLCYYNSIDKRAKSLPFFEKAIQNTTKNYDIFTHTEKQAPVESFYYLARVYHITANDKTQIDKALEYYNIFESKVSKKHYLIKDVTRQKEMCSNAKELMDENAQKDVRIVNLGKNVNSKYPEHSPAVSLDEKALYYTSKRLRKDSSNFGYLDEKGLYFDDIYVSYKDDHGVWQEPELLNINLIRDHTATISLSPDGQTLYIFKDAGGGNGNLYKSQFLGKEWSEPELLGSDINTQAFESHITVAPDNRTLYFVSDRKGGEGGRDIYRCKRLPTGDWSLAQNINAGGAATINTPYDEDAPFLHPDGKTLYFSSKGHKSMGGYDIFFSVLQDDGTWTKPKNIGYPINTTDDDVSYIESPDGKRAYYSSVKDEIGYGGKDIYMIEMPQAMEKNVTILEGHIEVGGDGIIPPDMLILVTDNETGEQVGEYRPRARDGAYHIVLQPGKNYNISYEAEDYEFYNTNIFIPFGSEYYEVNKAIMLQPVNIGGSGEIEQQKWQLKFNKLSPEIPNGLKISFYDDDGNQLFSENVDKKGAFSYRELPSDKNITMKLNTTDQSIKDNLLTITLIDNKGNEVTNIEKDDSGQFLYKKTTETFTTQATEPTSIETTTSQERGELPTKRWQIQFSKLSSEIPDGLTILFVDDNGKTISFGEVDKKGYFDYYELPKDKNIVMKLNKKDIGLCDKIVTIVLVDKEGKTIKETTKDENCQFRITKPTKLPSSPVTTIEPITTKPEEPITVTKTEKLSYQEFFGYNIKVINQNNPKFKSLINSIIKIVNETGRVSLSIESSASRVPTKTYKTNMTLTKLRAEQAKQLLLSILQSKGFDKSKVNFIDITTLVQGPKYTGDYKNTTKYEKYQYVKIYK